VYILYLAICIQDCYLYYRYPLKLSRIILIVRDKVSGLLTMNLAKHIDKNAWYSLQDVLIKSVIAGGTAAMEYYRKPLNNILEQEAEVDSKNPSTKADLHATLAIIHALHDYLEPIVKRLSFNSYSCLAEETQNVSWFQKKLPKNIFQKIKTTPDFFANTEDLRIIIDGIDGTGNFIRGIPMFCSAAAIIIDNRPRISALYDPVQHLVYSALLPGPDNDICLDAEAWEWHISSNHRIDLTCLNQKQKKSLSQEAIGIHFTRSLPDKLLEIIQSDNSILEKLSRASAGIYALNSGFIAMSYIARNALGAYINNSTYLWDIAAGEVLIRACGGKVTDFHKNQILYNSPSRIPVVVAKEQIYDELMSLLET